MSFLLATNVLSEVRKPAPDERVAAWFGVVPGRELFLSVLVIGEIRQGIERRKRRDARSAAALESWLQRLYDEYAERIVPITSAVAETWGRLNAPDPLPVVDGLIAATALTHEMTLVTRNVGDVERTGVRLLNPFA